MGGLRKSIIPKRSSCVEREADDSTVPISALPINFTSHFFLEFHDFSQKRNYKQKISPSSSSHLSMSSPSLPPSTLAIAISTGILGLVTGYFIGQGSSLGVFSSSSKAKKSWPNSYDVTVHPDSSDDELMQHLLGGRGGRVNGSGGRDEVGQSDSDEGSEDEEGEEKKIRGGLSAFEDSKEQEFKLVLVVRTDIGMQKGIYINPIFLFLARLSTGDALSSLSSVVLFEYLFNSFPSPTSQVKSPPSAPTPRSRTTKLSCDPLPPPPCSVGGKPADKRRLHCKLMAARRSSCL